MIRGTWDMQLMGNNNVIIASLIHTYVTIRTSITISYGMYIMSIWSDSTYVAFTIEGVSF